MTCSACGFDNPAGMKFCGSCGQRLVAGCASCGAENPPGFRFCGGCGRPLVAEPQPPPGGSTAAGATEARKVVTIVFADLVGSTTLHERLDAESVRRFMDRYYQAMRGAVEAEGGTVTQLLGDGVMAVFGVPRVAEDDAIRAVRAAVGMQHAFRELAEAQRGAIGKTGLRVAVNTGEVVASSTSEIIGDPVNVAARLQEQAGDGDVVIGEATRRLVGELVTLAPLGTFALKGRAETVAAHRVVSLERPAGAPATAFVGREDELERLTAVYETAVTTRRACLAVILGSPGLGKSRILAELARRVGDGATVLSAHCDATGGATFAPIAEALRTVLRLDAGANSDTVRAALDAVVPGEDTERARIAAGIAALLAGTPAPPEETFFVVRRFLTALAAAHPVLLAIDDLQWAEPLLLDLTEHLVQWSTTVPLMLLVAARPELRDTRSSLATPGGLVAEVVTLAGLDAGAATRLAANVIGADELPAAIAGRVLAASEGNPLFVGELVRMLVHDGALKREADRWTAGVELATLEMPPTIHALLAARIERLGSEERTVLERAAVIGRQFSRVALAHLLPRELTNVNARLESLRRSELIESDIGWFLGEPALRFHHVLIRDAAYRRVLKGTRAELHGRFADWLEARVGEAVEHEEMIGWHLEQAHQHLGELGPLDDSGRTTGERAARYLASAGRRALERDDVPLAASLLGRALDRLDPADSARADLALDWCEALLATGEVGQAQHAIDELGRFIKGSERLRAWHTCFAGQRAALTNPEALHATADAVAAAADTLTAAGDAAGEAKAHFVHAIALARLGRVGACEAALDRALAAARRGHDRRRANAVLAGAPLAALWGPSPVTRASGRCLDVVRVLRITQGAPAVEAVALRCQAVLEALRGRTEAARRMIASSRHLVEELGITQRLLEADMFAGLIELLEGDAVAAERSLRAAYEGLRANGLGIDAAQAAALLGRALLAQDRAAEAEALSHESEALAGDDLQAAMAWRCVRAEALARRGEHAAAVEFARAAVDLAAATDALLYHADARLALAAALRAAGRGDEAAVEEARAIELWDAKGATLLAERARGGTTASARAARAPVEAVVSPRATRPRIERNYATRHLARIDEAVTARDVATVEWLLGEAEAIDHGAGRFYGTTSLLAGFRWTIECSAGLTFGNEPIAVLGPSLALARWHESGSEVLRDDLPMGPFEIEGTVLVEADAEARSTRVEIFPAGKLGDSIVRLYERYADLLPDGPARTRAAATARSVAAWSGALDLDRLAISMAPAVESVDHRILGTWSARGAEASLQHWRAQFDVVASVNAIDHEVLALEPAAFLVRRTWFGTDRVGGGIFENVNLALFAFGADGLLTRFEGFDLDRADEALTRFDELTAELAPARFAAVPSRAGTKRARRVRPNAATANAARLDAALAARDADACGTLLATHTETVHHPTGLTYGREGALARSYSLFKAKDATFGHEPLATLGDALALCRMSWSASGAAGGGFDVGPYENAQIALIEVDARGQRRRAEFFADDRLGDAVARLYERYAELLPAGPAREVAVATARSVATVVCGPYDRERYSAMLAPAVEVVDHRTLGTWSARGVEAVLAHLRALLEVADDLGFRDHEVLGLRSDALLTRRTHSGTARDGGGAYERVYLILWVFGPDGLQIRGEYFDADREDEALARFDALAAEPAAARPVARRVRPNAATANTTRTDAALAARDADALHTLLAQSSGVVDHIRGVTFDRRGLLASWRSLLSARDPTSRHEPLASLGDALALCRLSNSASGFAGKTFDVGAYEREEIILVEVDPQGRRTESEIFASDRLGDAVARLYERYADLLPDGPSRARAKATARAVAALPVGARIGPADVDRYAAALAPAIEFVDRRTFGVGSTNGAEAYIGWVHALFELADDVGIGIEDVLGLRSDALLVRLINFGTQRAGGGVFERQFLILWVFGADGLVSRLEQFDDDRDAEALARFDELAAEPATARSGPALVRATETRGRRVRPNAATANLARLDSVLAAGDAAALPALVGEEAECVDHTTGVTFDREGVLSSWRLLLKAEDPRCRHVLLATLGDRLVLCHRSMSGSGFVGWTFDVGAYEREEIVLLEVDAHGRERRVEIFAPARLGDAIACLYERYADLLPDGPARIRAVARARAVAAYVGPEDLARFASTFAPLIDYVDHRTTIGMEPTRGAEAFLRGARALHEVADDVANRVDDVLALRPEAGLLHVTNFGRARAGGGAYERPFLALSVFGADGLLTRFEQFDADRDAEALARFDELTAEPPALRRRMRPNAATAHAARLDALIAVRDADALSDLFAVGAESVDHPTGTTWDRQGLLATWRSLLRAEDPECRHEPLATLGDSLALCRTVTSARAFAGGSFDVGAYENERIGLNEVDTQGRLRRWEGFAANRLGEAIVRLYERYAELAPDGPKRARAAAIARAVAVIVGPLDCDRYAATLAPSIHFVDYRTIGMGSTRSAEVFMRALRSLVEVADDVANRIDHVLALRADACLLHVTNFGTDRAGGGSYERPFLAAYVFDAAGLLTCSAQFDPDHDAEALARFDELMTTAPATRFANAATRAEDRVRDACEARDWKRFTALFPPGVRFIDRRRMVQLEIDRDEFLDSFRGIVEMTSSITTEVLATRGNRLAMIRVVWEGRGGTIGPSEVELLRVTEVDDSGEQTASIAFDPDDLDAAYAELDARYAAGEAAPYAGTWGAVQRYLTALAVRDWAGLTRMYAPDFVAQDHNFVLRLDEIDSPDDPNAWHRALVELAPDARARIDHVLALDDGRALGITRWVGTREGGSFEIPRVTVGALAADGRFRAIHTYDLDQLDAARACYETLVPAPVERLDTELSWPRIENAATRSRDRLNEAWAAKDWDRFAAVIAPGFRNVDRRRLVQLEIDREQWLAAFRPLFETASVPRPTFHVIATRGNRLAMIRVLLMFWGAADSFGPSEIEFLEVVEVDDHGDRVAMVAFDPDDLGAAYAELDACYRAGEAAAYPHAGWWMRQPIAAWDLDALAARVAPDHVVVDHRLFGWETVRGVAGVIEIFKSMLELAPDARLRIDHATISAHATLVAGAWIGTREGGAFEAPRIAVEELDPASGRWRRLDLYDPGQLAEARARFAAITAHATPDPLAALARPNAATAARDRLQTAFAARDWAAVRAAYAGDTRIEDRRRQALVAETVDEWIASMQRLAAEHPELRYERRLVATAGDRVDLERFLWRGGPRGGEFEIEHLQVTEVDDRGLVVSSIGFDSDDSRAAQREAWARWFASDATAAAVVGPAAAMIEASNDHDPVRVRAVLADDLVVHDQRRAGMGVLEGAEAYVESLVVLWELAPDIESLVVWWDLAPDIRFEPSFHLAFEPYGMVAVVRGFGTLRDGGAFDRPLVSVTIVAGGLLTRIELFEIDAVEAALARFAALRPDPLRIPPNAATRAARRLGDALEVRDWDVIGALCAPALVHDDRRRSVLLTSDRDMFIATLRFIARRLPDHAVGDREGSWWTRTLLATAGERLALERVRWAGAVDAPEMEIEMLAVVEVDAEGRLDTIINFDPDDHRAACAEMRERYARSDEARWIPAAFFEFSRALDDHDLDRLRAVVPPDFVFDDHRRTGVGRLERAEDYIAAVAALFEQAPDVIIESLYVIAEERHGRLGVARRFGTLAEGGTFESIFVQVTSYREDRLVAVELFEPEDLAVARARFEALRAARRSAEREGRTSGSRP